MGVNVEVEPFINVRGHAAALGCPPPGGLALLPGNFETAGSRADLVHDASALTIRAAWSSEGSKLRREAVARPHTRAASESPLQTGMVCDQGRRSRPRRKSVERFDEAHAYEGASAIALATRPAKLVQLRDQASYFGR